MDSELRAHLSEILQRNARELADLSATVPVDLVAIRNYLGLALRVEEAPAAKHGALLADPGGRRTIVLYRESRHALPLTRARFTVAHEIGHFLIDRATSYRPATKSDYWKLEALCDAFAGTVLLPDVCMPTLETSGAVSPVQLLSALGNLTKQGGLSLEATARRLSGHLGECGIAAGFGMILAWRANGRTVDVRRSEPIAEAAWVVGEVAGLGRRSRIRSGHDLFALVEHALTEARRPAAIAEMQVCGDLGNTRVVLQALNPSTLLLAAITHNDACPVPDKLPDASDGQAPHVRGGKAIP